MQTSPQASEQIVDLGESGDHLIWQQVYPEYELVEHLGQGSFGDVYKAIHVETGRTVAIKLM